MESAVVLAEGAADIVFVLEVLVLLEGGDVVQMDLCLGLLFGW